MKANKFYKKEKISVKKYLDGGVTPPGPGDKRLVNRDLLLRQLWRESRFDPQAESGAGAEGLAQFTGITTQELYRLGIFPQDSFDPFNPRDALRAQQSYMNYIAERPWVKGNNDKVIQAKILAAYNMGPDALLSALNKAKDNGVNIYDNFSDFMGYLPRETQIYVNDILGIGENSTFEEKKYKERLPEFSSYLMSNNARYSF